MPDWTTTRARIKNRGTAALVEWALAPRIARGIWIATHAVALLVLVWIAVRQPDGVLPALPVLFLTGLVAVAGVVARTACSAWCLRSPAHACWPTAVTVLPQVLLLMVFLPHVTALAAGSLMAILFHSASLAAGWNLLCAPLPGESSPSLPAQEVLEPVAEASESQTQWMRRSSPGPGEDVVEGGQRVVFARGEKVAAVHLPISPPFPATPQVECEVTADSDIRTTVTARYPYGFRVELRRSDPSTEETCELAFIATATASSDRDGHLASA